MILQSGGFQFPDDTLDPIPPPTTTDSYVGLADKT